MKVFICLVALIAITLAYPQRDGASYTNEAINQAKNTLLIPKDAIIHQVQESVELGAYENIRGGEKFDLQHILGDRLPPAVIKNLQIQVDQIGQN